MLATTDRASALQPQVQQFYVRQMQLLDEGRTDEWAQTFCADGVFAVGDDAVAGAAAIAAAARVVADDFAARRIVRRHWIGMLDVEECGAEIRTRCYAMVLEISDGGEVVVRRSTVCSDVLVADGATWRVKHRTVVRDGVDHR